jgi:hypothetical protein
MILVAKVGSTPADHRSELPLEITARRRHACTSQDGSVGIRNADR